MKEVEDVVDIHHLQRQGLSQRAIARRLELHRSTVKKYLENPQAAAQLLAGPGRRSPIAAYDEQLRAWLAEDESYRATRLYDRLRELGYTGSYDPVQRRVKALKAASQQTAYLRFETEPGQIGRAHV